MLQYYSQQHYANQYLEEVDQQNYSEFLNQESNRTKDTLTKSIPKKDSANPYILLHKGSGNLELKGYGKILEKLSDVNGFHRFSVLIDPSAVETKNQDFEARHLELQITNINSSDYIKDIHLIMPGGICFDPENFYDSFKTYVLESSVCKNGKYHSFESFYMNPSDWPTYQNSQKISAQFNPIYLNFMKDFGVLRAMNFMLASPRLPDFCQQITDENQKNGCIIADYPASFWENRPTLSDASWGESYLTEKTNWKGVPLEVIIELANQLNVAIWVNIPHYWNDEYISNAAKLISQSVIHQTQFYVEYSNELWNGGFWSYHYAKLKETRLLSQFYENYKQKFSLRSIGENSDDYYSVIAWQTKQTSFICSE